jgi:23S rRNA (guanosine2251-2'-O)-methyltransferase
LHLNLYRQMKKPHREEPKDKDYIYGARAVMEAMEAGRQIDKVLVRKGLDSELRNDVAEQARKSGIPIQVVPPETLDRIARGANHQGVLAFTGVIRYADLEDILTSATQRGEVPLIVMLDQVSDVRNFGAIARTAECMGAHAIVIPEQGAARINADAMKVSAGALNYLPVCRAAHLMDAVHLLKDLGVTLVALTEKATENIFNCPLTDPVCLLFGSEDDGINPRLLRSADHLAGIPMFGNIGSLNVSVAAGMVLAETMRQRRFTDPLA